VGGWHGQATRGRRPAGTDRWRREAFQATLIDPLAPPLNQRATPFALLDETICLQVRLGGMLNALPIPPPKPLPDPSPGQDTPPPGETPEPVPTPDFPLPQPPDPTDVPPEPIVAGVLL
jgi:hypothetical protein